MSARDVEQGKAAVRRLLQIVCRTFYGPRQAILVDQLIRKEVMRDDELAGRVELNAKYVAKGLGQLLVDQIVDVYQRNEQKEGNMKASPRTYYYINYSVCVNVIRWKLFKMHASVSSRATNVIESQGYVCPRCTRTYTTLDVLSLVPAAGDSDAFICETCGAEVADNQEGEDVQKSKQMMLRMQEQTKTVQDALRRVDECPVVPRLDVVAWLELNLPLTATKASAAAGGAEDTKALAMRVMVDILPDDDEDTIRRKREQNAEIKRAQNALPSWIANSTVDGSLGGFGGPGGGDDDTKPFDGDLLSSLDGGEDEAKPSTSGAAGGGEAALAEEVDIEAYYAELEREAAEEEAAAAANGSGAVKAEESDDDDEDFEEAVFLPPPVPEVAVDASGSGKRSRIPSHENDEEAEPSKRARTEPAVAPVAAAEDEDEDDEDEFEEVDAPSARETAAEETESGFEEDKASARGKPVPAYEDEEDDDEAFEAVETVYQAARNGDDDDDDEDPNDPDPVIEVGGQRHRFSEVQASEEMQNMMTEQEYEIFSAVFQRLDD